jgi:hypothetical protein
MKSLLLNFGKFIKRRKRSEDAQMCCLSLLMWYHSFKTLLTEKPSQMCILEPPELWAKWTYLYKLPSLPYYVISKRKQIYQLFSRAPTVYNYHLTLPYIRLWFHFCYLRKVAVANTSWALYVELSMKKIHLDCGIYFW